MNQQTEKRVLLADTLPAFTTELHQLLVEHGEPELAAQVLKLVFFYERTQNAPPPPTQFWGFEDPRSFLQRVNETQEMKIVFDGYQIETLEMYEYRFQRRVLAF